ncbi:WD40 repeat-like protein [Ramaria rubella]|nr:WD40 repeat-like protein [Ramaria rubella]
MTIFTNNLLHSHEYHLLGRMKGHTDAIHVLAIAKNGKLLTSGGLDGVRLWDMTTLVQLGFPRPQYGVRGQVSCMTWVPRDLTRETLCYGTGLGFLVYCSQTLREGNFEEVWSNRIGKGFEITCITCNNVSGRITIGTRDSIVQVWNFNSNKGLHPLFSVQLDSTVPKSLCFVDNTAQDLYLFGMYNGQWHTLRGDDGKILSSKDTGKMISHADISVKYNQFIVDNATDGFDIHQLDNGAHIRTLPTGIPKKRVLKQVTFGEDSQIIVRGSDHGIVYLFERESGRLITMLNHSADKGLVQTVATHETEGSTVILCASSSNTSNIDISLWTQKKVTARANDTWKVCNLVVVIEAMFKLGMFLASMAFLYQNTKDQAMVANIEAGDQGGQWGRAIDEGTEVKAIILLLTALGTKSQRYQTKREQEITTLLVGTTESKIKDWREEGMEEGEDGTTEDKVSGVVTPETGGRTGWKKGGSSLRLIPQGQRQEYKPPSALKSR